MIHPDRVVTTTCPYCGVGCSLELHIKDDYIYKVTSPFDSPVNHGSLCVKGRFGYDFIFHPQRVTTPLIRKTPQVPGERSQAFELSEWRPVSWDEALDYVADRLVEIYRRDGPQAMAVYLCAKATNEDNYLLQKMFRTLFRTNNVDHCTRLCHAGSVVALQHAVGSSAMSNTAAEVVKADVFIVTGSNTAENHPIIANQMKDAVIKHGAKMIVIDPRRVELCNYAMLWLPLKPGTNVPLFSAMAHVIVSEGLVNEKFVAERTEGYAEYIESLEKFTPEYAESVTGVDAGLIRQAARTYAKAERGAIYWGMGISQLTHGTSSALALIHLAFLTGHIGREGTGLNPLRGQNNVQGASDMGAMPFHLPGYMTVDNPANAAKWEQAWNVEPGRLSQQRGLTTTEILSNVRPGGVRSLYIMGENPMMSEPNLNLTRHHMQQLEFLVAQDLFINESGSFADVFLPAAAWAEKEGTFTNTDRRVQRVRRALPPRGQARPDWEIVCDLARRLEARLGYSASAGWNFSHPSEVLAEMSRVVPDYAGVKYERIEKVGLQTPVLDDQHPGTPILFKEKFPRGRGRFTPLEFVPSAELPDDEYPFILTTGRVLEHWHGGSMTRHSVLDDLYPQPLVQICDLDAAELGIQDGQPVKVASRRGFVILRAAVSQKVTPGVVFIPFHFAEAAANLLTNDALDPQAKIPEFKACAVQVFPAHEEELLNPANEKRGRY
ncbi:MAG TPA: formate dehydrogenase subunit alpha [Anaerolineales bacterium]